MKKLLTIGLLLFVAGCATTQDPNIAAGNSLLATQQTIINIHESFRTPCKTGVVPKDVCQQVDKLTFDSMPIYDAAVDASIVEMQSGVASVDAKAKKEALEKLAGDMVALSVKYGVKGETK
jgi:hypothetical protein